MKRLLKSGLKVLWRATAPLRRPFVRKLEGFLMRCLRPTEAMLANETNVLMDHVIRELVRLRRQVEEFQHTIDDLTLTTAGLAIVTEAEPADESDNPVNEHLKAS